MSISNLCYKVVPLCGAPKADFTVRKFSLSVRKIAMITLLLLGFFCNINAKEVSAVQDIATKQDTTVFKFRSYKNRFLFDYKENKRHIKTFGSEIMQRKHLIDSGLVKIRVMGYCHSLSDNIVNMKRAANRSNQVKSYYIVHYGMKEDYYLTTNQTVKWNGLNDVVLVTFIDVDRKSEGLAEVASDEGKNELVCEDCPDYQQDTVVCPEEIEEFVTDTFIPAPDTLDNNVPQNAEVFDNKGYNWGIKTNALYLAATVANLGVEFSVGKHFSIDVPVMYSPYTVARNYRMRFLVAQPEFRYWLKDPMHKGHFFGLHLNIGAFNLSVNNKNRYQTPDGFYGAGLSYGYALPFAKHWLAEFTVGVGYFYTEYDTYYNIDNGALYESGVPFHYFGPTKLGISIVYRFGK